MGFKRLPRHVGFIPDGNRRWAEARGRPRREGYRPGVEPGIRLLRRCRDLGIEEISIYGFTKENVRRSADQVAAFQAACVEFARRAADAGTAVLAVGDADSSVFPDGLRAFVRTRSGGDLRVNLLVNYGWRWDLLAALGRAREGATLRRSALHELLASRDVSRVDLVVRWGGRRRLSGFLPVQCAYADLFVVDTLWPDSRLEEFDDALRWYQDQDVTLGG